MHSTAVLVRRGVDWFEGGGRKFRRINSDVVFTPIASSVLPCASGHPHEPKHERGPFWLFREDAFDPVTRIRRGRLYRYDDTHRVTYDNTAIEDGLTLSTEPTFTPDVAFVAFFPSQSEDQVGCRLPGAQMEIGVAPFFTSWRVVGVEGVPAGAGAHLLLTLKAVSSLGAMPELKEELRSEAGIPIDGKPIREEIDRVIEALHRQQAVPIVDVCREAARVILSGWLGSAAAGKKNQDLGTLIGSIDKKKAALSAAAQIVNRLHSRGKSAAREEQDAKGQYLRPPIDEDADLGVRLVGFILRDLGWAVH